LINSVTPTQVVISILGDEMDRFGAPGAWRLVPGWAPDQVLSEPRPWRDMAAGRISSRDWTIGAGRLYVVDASEPGRRRAVSTSLAGGGFARIADVPDEFVGSLAVNHSRTAEIVYAGAVDGQSDIGIVRSIAE
jgi:hypothetical protein